MSPDCRVARAVRRNRIDGYTGIFVWVPIGLRPSPYTAVDGTGRKPYTAVNSWLRVYDSLVEGVGWQYSYTS